MSSIGLDTLEAFTEAVVRNHDDVTPRELVGMLRRLDDEGWHLARKPAPEPVVEAPPAPPMVPAYMAKALDLGPDEFPF